MLRSIGVAELRQNASKYLREVERGEVYRVTDRGRPVAILQPLRFRSRLDELEAQGRLRRGRGAALARRPAAPRRGVPLPSELLRRMREEERS